METGVTGIKPIFKGKKKGYVIDVITNVCSLGAAASQGYYVFNDVAKALRGIDEGVMLSTWPKARKAAVRQWLVEQLTAPADA
jgi:hypothetical protein